MKEKMKAKDNELTLGREGAFGQSNEYKVKKLRNEHWLSTARNKLNLRKYSEDNSLIKKTALPPPQLGKSMGHGILKS